MPNVGELYRDHSCYVRVLCQKVVAVKTFIVSGYDGNYNFFVKNEKLVNGLTASLLYLNEKKSFSWIRLVRFTLVRISSNLSIVEIFIKLNQFFCNNRMVLRFYTA